MEWEKRRGVSTIYRQLSWSSGPVQPPPWASSTGSDQCGQRARNGRGKMPKIQKFKFLMQDSEKVYCRDSMRHKKSKSSAQMRPDGKRKSCAAKKNNFARADCCAEATEQAKRKQISVRPAALTLLRGSDRTEKQFFLLRGLSKLSGQRPDRPLRA
jgi:hypothetical protein